MSLNVPLLKQRYRSLFGGSVLCDRLDTEDLNIMMKLKLEGKPYTNKDILIFKMQATLEKISFNDPHRPFLIAVKQIYEITVK